MNRKRKIRAALVYDFDGTLSPSNMQEYSFIPDLGMDAQDFWKRTQRRAREQDADPILAYMNMMLDLAEKRRISVKRDYFVKAGRAIRLFPGVTSWFARQTEYAATHGLDLEHYIVSSGLREMIEGSSIGQEFKRIYASGFMYGRDGIATWPALAVNYTTKTQFLFRINKGSPNVYDDSLINDFVPKDKRCIPFENMIFVGDGATDVPCMRLVKDQGGHSIAVYRANDSHSRKKARQLFDEGRVNFIAPANYAAEHLLDRQVRGVIDKLAADKALGSLGKRD